MICIKFRNIINHLAKSDFCVKIVKNKFNKNARFFFKDQRAKGKIQRDS